ncbi:MarR family winged helix-turn-helix transcriptional regulator [Nocardia rosealba]|uniref:MarR family winged helix-turn-helix transcriptional regulator n=2 Tax=Nocardia TaxID=1817 RepID=UPI001CD9F7D2|nr:MarR family transcriptional regulator [Nocardia rosealba]MCA2206653.1 MarR family transcriptional regulator [Nocardia rosealba]
MRKEPMSQSEAYGRYERIHEGMRAYGANYREFTRRFAGWLGLHSTDAEALIEILSAEERGSTLSPARLSERISLSNSATTALLNRLEQAGHIVRSREHDDRRVITLRSTPRIHALANDFFGPLGTKVEESVMGKYSPEDLRRFEAFLADIHATMTAHLSEPAPPPPGKDMGNSPGTG